MKSLIIICLVCFVHSKVDPLKPIEGTKFVLSRVKYKFDLNGKELTTLVDTYQPPGSYTVSVNSRRIPLPGGIYYCRITAGNFSKNVKMICLNN